MKVRISRCVVEAVQRAAAAAHPREACGLLFGAEGAITGWQETRNVAADPERHFEIDPRALFDALRAERTGGPRIAGYFHSHPGGEARPSPIDEAMSARDGSIWMIVAGDSIGVWKAGADGFEALGWLSFEDDLEDI